jgi:two-component system chemotaxis response regulator CheY
MTEILVADDVAFNRMQLKDMITKLGHQVIGEIENGKVGVEKYNELNPDCI